LQILVFLPCGMNRCVWRCLPGFVQRFIENQNGDDSFRAAVRDSKGEAKDPEVEEEARHVDSQGDVLETI